MPYIKPENRSTIDPLLEPILNAIEKYKGCDDGNLNYIITKIVHKQIESKGLSYTNLNAIIGVLDCAKMELYRMIAARYEDKKKRENGFISGLDRITKDEKQAIWKCKECGTIFTDSEVVEICGHETYYQCPRCGAESKYWEEIRESID